MLREKKTCTDILFPMLREKKAYTEFLFPMLREKKAYTEIPFAGCGRKKYGKIGVMGKKYDFFSDVLFKWTKKMIYIFT
jgi:hypothetical protein